ncbi:hypothetical protein ACIHFC_32230 [Streptomyces sp. NPDC052013]|uniref:hypothetical protein n=1 Tax=Streptomyces sp. NPDC052013 TaxID=3365679 RepID=UPI0037D3ECA0
MGMLLAAATGMPTILFTAGLGVVVCFWLLVAVGRATPRAFDADVDLEALGMGGVPVAVVLSLLTAIAWVLGTSAALLLAAHGPSGVAGGLLRLSASAAALRLTRLVVPRLGRLFRERAGRGRTERDTAFV